MFFPQQIDALHRHLPPLPSPADSCGRASLSSSLFASAFSPSLSSFWIVRSSTRQLAAAPLLRSPILGLRHAKSLRRLQHLFPRTFFPPASAPTGAVSATTPPVTSPPPPLLHWAAFQAHMSLRRGRHHRLHNPPPGRPSASSSAPKPATNPCPEHLATVPNCGTAVAPDCG